MAYTKALQEFLEGNGLRIKKETSLLHLTPFTEKGEDVLQADFCRVVEQGNCRKVGYIYKYSKNPCKEYIRKASSEQESPSSGKGKELEYTVKFNHCKIIIEHF
jgi:hypothetical protein